MKTSEQIRALSDEELESFVLLLFKSQAEYSRKLLSETVLAEPMVYNDEVYDELGGAMILTDRLNSLYFDGTHEEVIQFLYPTPYSDPRVVSVNMVMDLGEELKPYHDHFFI